MADHDILNRWMKTVALLVVLVIVGANSHAQDKRSVKQVNVLGTALIQKNVVEGRQNAVDDALVAAVGQVVVEMLTGETVVRRFKLINDSILTQKDKYIQNYRVLTESTSGNTIRALVQVDVAVDRVSRDLGQLGVALAGAAYPRILLMVAEKNVNDASFSYWWGDRRVTRRTICEQAMAENMQSTGFDIIEPPDLSTPLGLPIEVPKTQILSLAGRLGADVVVVANGSAAAAPNTMGDTITAFESIVRAQAFTVENGQAIGRTQQKSVVSGQDAFSAGREALAAAGALVGDALGRKIMIAWQREQDRSALVQVVVEGTGGHIASFVRVRTAIATLSGVKDLKMQEMTADRANMAVSYQGSTRSLADALLLKTFTGFGIDIYDVTPESVHIRLVHQ
jgi:hypothetical protein